MPGCLYPKLWTADYMAKMYVSKHRDYAFQRMIKNGSINADDILIEMLEPLTIHNSFTRELFYDVVGDDDGKMLTQYKQYLAHVYKAIVGHYPTVNEIRTWDKTLDTILSLSDNTVYSLDKKRKL